MNRVSSHIPASGQAFYEKPFNALEKMIYKVWTSLFSKNPTPDEVKNTARQIKNRFDPLSAPLPKQMTKLQSEQLAQKIWGQLTSKPLTAEEVKLIGEELRKNFGYNQTVINEINK